MKTLVRNISFSLSCMIFISSSVPLYAEKSTSDFWSDVATGCAYAGAALLGVGGAIGVGVKIFSDEPHHKLIARAQEVVSITSRDFQPLIAIVVGLNQIGYAEGDDVYRIGDFIIDRSSTVERCLTVMRHTGSKLRDLSGELKKRILMLQRDPSPYNDDLRFSMIRIKQELDALSANMSFAESYIHAREHYIAFHEVAKKTYNQYRSIIEVYYKYGIGYAFEEEIKQAVMHEASQEGNSYPYMDFYMRIDANTKRLASVLRRISGTPSIHLKRGSDLAKVLDIMKNTVSNSAAYAYEYNMYTQRKAEKERVEAMNNQIAQERRRVTQMQEQLDLDQRRLREMERANCARIRDISDQHYASAPISATVHINL